MNGGDGRLRARPMPGERAAGGAGGRALGLGEGRRDGLVHVPLKVHPARPAPLIVLLHGAGGDARGVLPILREQADLYGAVVLAPESRGQTWDVIGGGYGPDVAFIDRALGQVFARHAVDPERVAVAGFSDGASYALSLGLTNGDLFSDVLAFSPGFAAPAATIGQPKVFISHGEDDRVLPIDRCSRVIAPRLRRAGYDVDYREFDGGHVIPPEMVQLAIRRFLQS